MKRLSRIPKSTLLKLGILSVMVFSLFMPSGADAQSRLEKLAVARSKLIDPVFTKHDPASILTVDHSQWDRFLKTYVAPNSDGVNLVTYGSVSDADRKALSEYRRSLQATDVTRLNRNEQYAFWLNLYNASIVQVVLDNWPIDTILSVKSSPVDLKGPFNDPVAVVNGVELTPDGIESGIVRPVWKDPLLHYGFNCAAISCPNLRGEAFTGVNIGDQLINAAKRFINSPRGVRVDNGKVILSKIYFWYDGDFGGSEKAVLQHISNYAGEALRTSLSSKSKVHSYRYDWKLNVR